ncbi:MAG: amidohydrolase family protein [Acidobacteria bacterium]|nr:amidohydrolase family protein [Acidobacteriota bacterium]
MIKHRVGIFLLIIGACLLRSVLAQQGGDMILHNAKIVMVDDHGFSSRIGTVAQAMQVRDGKVVRLGSNEEIRASAGPGTQVIDLKGRTVLPGFILTHEHPWDWNPVEPPVVKGVLTDDIVVARFLEGSPEENLKAFPGVLAEAVSKAKPGQWIYIVLTYGKQYEYGPWGTGRFGRMGLDPKAFDPIGQKRITREQLDAAAPNNPGVVRDVFVSMVVNQKAAEESRKVFPEPDVNPVRETGPATSFRWMFQDVVMKDHYPQLVELMRLGMEWWAGYGMTTFSSNAYGPSNVKVYDDLDRKGQMPIREMWTWNWRLDYFYSDPYFLTTLRAMTGRGSDYFWLGGGRIIEGGRCTTAEPLPTSRLAKMPELQSLQEARRSECAYAPGTKYAKLLYDYIKAGGRFVNHHTIGDRDIDNILAIILRASRDAGMTDEEIRAKRHAFDHSAMAPRPDQVKVFQQLGIYASGTAWEIYDSPAVMDVYGETVADWVVPRKRLVDSGIYNTLELDHALGSTDLTIFDGLYWTITRKGWDGKVYAPGQAVDRQIALKIATIWGAYYVERENVLGSLEPGKWADFMVLDKDYLTVPVEDIPRLRVLMTVVGGKTIHLVPSLAREIGLSPAGAQVTLGGAAAQW